MVVPYRMSSLRWLLFVRANSAQTCKNTIDKTDNNNVKIPVIFAKVRACLQSRHFVRVPFSSLIVQRSHVERGSSVTISSTNLPSISSHRIDQLQTFKSTTMMYCDDNDDASTFLSLVEPKSRLLIRPSERDQQSITSSSTMSSSSSFGVHGLLVQPSERDQRSITSSSTTNSTSSFGGHGLLVRPNRGDQESITSSSTTSSASTSGGNGLLFRPNGRDQESITSSSTSSSASTHGGKSGDYCLDLMNETSKASLLPVQQVLLPLSWSKRIDYCSNQTNAMSKASIPPVQRVVPLLSESKLVDHCSDQTVEIEKVPRLPIRQVVHLL